MIRAVLAFCILLAVGVLVCGCTAGSLSQAEQQSLAEAAAAPTKLQPGDKIRITVFGEDSKHPVKLSITHNFGSDSGSQRDVGQAR